MISDAVEAYLASLEVPGPRDTPAVVEVAEPAPRDELDDDWFQTFDESAHARYEDDAPSRFGRLGAWLTGGTRASAAGATR